MAIWREEEDGTQAVVSEKEVFFFSFIFY